MIEKIIKENTDKLILIDFWAEWCGPCKVIGPILDELAEKYKDNIIVIKVNVDEMENEGIVSEYLIRNIPTIIFVKNEDYITKIVGAAQKTTIEEKILENL